MIFINLENIKNIGPKRLNIFHKMNIYSLEDLLTYYPYKYQLIKLTPLIDNEISCINVKVVSLPIVRYIKRNLNSLNFKIEYNSTIIDAVIFNRAFMKNNIKLNEEIFIIGKYDKLKNKFIINDIRFSKLLKEEIDVKYHLVNGMKNSTLKKIINDLLKEDVVVTDYIPNIYKEKYNFLDKEKALKIIHQPENLEQLKKAKLRLIYEELFLFSFKINYLKKLKEKESSFLKRNDVKDKVNEFIKSLPFELTIDQQKSIDEIMNDLNSKKRMNRLLLGDVGSGKTIVSFLALYANFLTGYQGALMAPTEVLAYQHYKSIKTYFANLNLTIELLTGSMSKGEKNSILKRLKQNEIDIIISTHSIISANVEFANLGLVVTDEQHRFGVNQRKNFQNKGLHPDVLYLSATPIPRTYALTLYGDMDISFIKSKPKNRLPVKTYVLEEKQIKKVLEEVFQEIKNNHQIYVVAPAISNDEESDINDVLKLKQKFQRAFLNKVRIEILHSKIKQKEKDAIMNDFKENKIKILISTTVIEVGIDNPNATIMVIFNAERFGLATLHQLRGRVGRGNSQSTCFLISNKKTERLNILASSNDGFYIASKDFELRGQGDIFGERQSGDLSFKISDIKRDLKIFLQAEKDSQEFIKNNYELKFINTLDYLKVIEEMNFLD